ncbi:MAG TPA: Rho termination factor N-terminal domain-containing protein, partial [Solirubrobacteraceae bacterium]|nr:Rho termination factor N-terminal domain-containing protein [Solirubrobacteraceae bacterium]
MPVLERNELEASPLADLHAIASQVGLDGFRRLRKADLIDAILGDAPAEGSGAGSDDEDADARPKRRRGGRSRSATARSRSKA